MAVAARGHRRREVAREHDRRAQVDVERAVDLVRPEGVDPAAGGQRRVGHEHVDLARPARQRRDLLAIGQVGDEHLDPRAQIAGQALEHVGLAPADQHRRAAGVQPPRDRDPDPARRAGDQRPGAGYVHV